MINFPQKKGMLLVANWDSNVGFAWWLMESYWTAIADYYENDYKIFLAYPSISKIPAAIASSKIQIETLEAAPSKGSFFKQIRFILSNGIRVIYYSDQKVAHWKYLVFRLAGVSKIIVHDHTPGLRSDSTGLKGRIKQIINNSVLSAGALFASSDFVKQRFVNTYRAKDRKCFLVRNGIPFLELDRQRRILHQFNIEDDQVVIVGTGRASSYKGVGFALKCIKRIIDANQNEKIIYLYCGDGPDLNLFKDLAIELGITDRVRFPGRVKSINEVCAACDIAFHPSNGEVGYSLSILEYMRAKLPAVLPDNPSVCGATIHNQTGLIYREGDELDAVECLMKLIQSQKLRNTLGSQSSLLVREKYSLSKTHQMLIDSFKATLDY